VRDKEFKSQCKRVKKVAKKWLTNLGLMWWNVKIEYHDTVMFSDVASGFETAMMCTAQWQYLQAVIDVYVPTIAEMDDDALERCFIHECMHILVNEMRETDGAFTHEERVCETLAKAFQWVEELCQTG